MHHEDLFITAAINGLAGHHPALDALVVQITTLGVPAMVLAVALQWWRVHNRLEVRHVLVAAGLTFLLGLALNQGVLLFVHRIRPYDAGLTHLIIAPSTDFSFPSDHATASFGIAFAFLLHGLKHWGKAFLAAALLIGLSRIYVGTHYVSDILGGMATALVAAILVRFAYRPQTRIDRLVTGLF